MYFVIDQTGIFRKKSHQRSISFFHPKDCGILVGGYFCDCYFYCGKKSNCENVPTIQKISLGVIQAKAKIH